MPTTKEKKTMLEDLVELQSAIPVMPKTANNPFFKSSYTPLDTITETVFPLLRKHNFAWVTMPDHENGSPILKYSLLHTSGEGIRGEIPLLLKGNDSQAMGSAITYARRYAITSVLGIVSDEDDDGNAAKEVAKQARASYSRETGYEEPAIQVGADAVDDNLRHEAKIAMAKAGLHGDVATEFIRLHLDKDEPTADKDFQVLIDAANAMEKAAPKKRSGAVLQGSDES